MLRITLGVTCVLLVSSASGQVDERFDFDVPGVLPSQDPEIAFCFAQETTIEGDVFSVQDGALRVRLFPTLDSAYYVSKDCTLFDAGLDPARPATMEARLRVIRAEGPIAAAFGFFDATHRYDVFLADDRAWVRGEFGDEAAAVALDVSIERTYRLESPPNSPILRLFVDDDLALATHASTTPANMFYFGGGQHPDSTGDADWDFVRIDQTAPVCAADVDGDRTIGVSDLDLVLRTWGTGTIQADVDADGDVGLSDLIALLHEWGSCASAP